MEFETLHALASWLKSTALSGMINQSRWVWPAAETLHFIGLALLVGTVILLDLRMLGMAKGLRLAGLRRLTRWGIAGFALNVITGAVFFIAAPFQYVNNVVFQLKIVFIVLAGINALIFELRILPAMEDLGPYDDAPRMAKTTAAVSLVLWLGVMFLGRMLPFLGEAF